MSDPVTDALRRGDAAAALEAARTAVQERPDDAEAHHLLGIAQRLMGDTDAAGASIERAIALAPDRPLYHMSRSALALAGGELEAAAGGLDEAVALDPNRLPAYVAQSQLALARGDLAEAEQRLLRALRIDGEDPRALVALGNLRLAQRDLDAALKAYTHAVKVAPNDAVAQSCLGVAYLKRGMLGFAEQSLRNALSARPQLASARQVLVEVLLRQGRAPEAAEEARRLAEDGGQASGWRLLGEIEAAAGHDAEAERALLAALDGAPDDRRALQALVALWQRSGAIARAREYLDQRLAGDPGFEAGWQQRLALERGDREGSVEVAARWFAAQPDSAAAAEAMAQIAEARGEHERAGELAARATAKDPGRIGAQLVAARAELRRAPAEAVARLAPLAAAERDPLRRRPLLGWLGHAEDAAGNEAAALGHWLAGHALSDRGGTLPPLGALDERLDALLAALPEPGAVAADPAQPPPTLLVGAPGSGVERLAALLRGQAALPLLDDRFGSTPRSDRFLSPDYDRWMADDAAAHAELAASWREGLASRGMAGLPVIEWLQRWDARFLPAIAHALPGTRFVVAIRDPRDTLLNWIAFGAPQRWPVRDLAQTARWLALAIAHEWQIGSSGRFPLAVIALEELESRPEAVVGDLSQFLGLEQPPDPAAYLRSTTGPGGWPTALPAGSWRRYATLLAEPFDALAPVIRAFGYPES